MRRYLGVIRFPAGTTPLLDRSMLAWCRKLPLSRRVKLRPRTIVLGYVELLQLLPSAQRLLARGTSLSSEEVAHEVDVAINGDLRERLFGQVQPNVFLDQVPVAELDAVDELLFSPAIEPISRAGFPFQAGNKLLGLSFKKILGFLVVRVDRYGKTEAEPLFDVLGSRCL